MEHILWSGEAHFHPQTLFLLNGKMEHFPFDYVGDLRHLDEILHFVLLQFAAKKEGLSRNAHLRTYRKREHSPYYEHDFSIKRSELSDDDIMKICKIYWIDYICLPFDVPHQCNLTDLFATHYKKHVTYNECYF